ncbi:MAG: hypothetical protein V4760_04360 [Bdellovibrionota bacterium]
MAKKYLLFFSLGLLVGVACALIFARQKASVVPSPTSPTTNQNPDCPVCPTCEEVVAATAKIPPPEWVDETKEYIANDDGEVTIRFKPVKGSVKHRVTVVDGRNGRVRTFATKRDWVIVKDIPIASDATKVTYGIVLSSMNILGQEGDFGEKRKITIKGRPELVAPTIKAITIED